MVENEVVADTPATKPEPKKFTVIYSEEEVMGKIRKLQASEDVALFLKMQEGQREYEELQALVGMVQKQTKGN